MEKQMHEGLSIKASDKLEDHITIFGYNEMVESLVHELEDLDIPFIVIDDNEHHIRTLHEDEVECLFGDPTDEDVLINSRICKAKLLIANCR
ncbi:MAG: NAD-binding protein [Methanosarcinales archaeon]|nr:NAD-binding protein [Methanosarcinales archaeon]